ncbi:hypothetical protein PPERSA_12461 [Pseudocohnilembus persalinus]|uniref:Uncharacterized protein n=1 Tax=Pseudocohnilembus persalinus TaxID=266149 RepID=A0A0V0QP02_PSEPJ|nr:hypothetical protein PPERSA_12461 [Pseudocohnilembus persalinus]|eukprot:KRX04014.1 hypothetical protein PPERSA_12461 [Pseudocohnilembus persalinus]
MLVIFQISSQCSGSLADEAQNKLGYGKCESCTDCNQNRVCFEGTCCGYPFKLTDCKNNDYFQKENPDHTCNNDCDCTGSRFCSSAGWCHGTAQINYLDCYEIEGYDGSLDDQVYTDYSQKKESDEKNQLKNNKIIQHQQQKVAHKILSQNQLNIKNQQQQQKQKQQDIVKRDFQKQNNVSMNSEQRQNEQNGNIYNNFEQQNNGKIIDKYQNAIYKTHIDQDNQKSKSMGFYNYPQQQKDDEQQQDLQNNLVSNIHNIQLNIQQMNDEQLQEYMANKNARKSLTCCGLPFEQTNCKKNDYIQKENSDHTCQTDCDCYGNRYCSDAGWCHGTGTLEYLDCYDIEGYDGSLDDQLKNSYDEYNGISSYIVLLIVGLLIFLGITIIIIFSCCKKANMIKNQQKQKMEQIKQQNILQKQQQERQIIQNSEKNKGFQQQQQQQEIQEIQQQEPQNQHNIQDNENLVKLNLYNNTLTQNQPEYNMILANYQQQNNDKILDIYQNSNQSPQLNYEIKQGYNYPEQDQYQSNDQFQFNEDNIKLSLNQMNDAQLQEYLAKKEQAKPFK